MNKRLLWAVLISLAVTAAAAVTRADDVIAPTWRGEGGTTYQEWRFDTGANPSAPEVATNPYGKPEASVVVGLFGSGWIDQLEGMGTKTGYWDLGGAGTITLDIPNSPVANPYKDIWVQVTYYEDISQAPTVDIAGATRLGGETRLAEHVDTGGDWFVDQSMWRIQPNPSSESIVLTSDPDWGGVIDQVVVDTRCSDAPGVPEPASITALLLGCGAMLFRRRNRR